MLENWLWQDRIKLSLHELVYDVLQEDFELFTKLEKKLEPVLLSALDTDFEFEFKNGVNG